MSSDFFDTTIGDQLTLQRGFDITKKQQTPGNVPVVSSGGVSSYHNEAKVKGPGVVLGRKGTLGTVFFLERDYWPHDTSLWVKDFKGNNPRFVYYFFKNISSTIKRMDVGAANPALNRNHVHPMEVRWPKRKVQDSIVEVLEKPDYKITINQQTNQTLESIAQAIFKSWFVDFEPTRAKIAAKQAGQDPERAAMAVISGKALEELDQLSSEQLEQLKATAALFPDEVVESELGEVPEGWEVKSLDDIAHYQNGLALQKFRPEDDSNYLPVLKIAQLKKGFADGVEKASPDIKPECIVANGDVVFSWSGSLVVDIWCGGKVALNQHLFKVTSTDYPKWFYYYWTKHHLEVFQQIAADKAVTMGHIKRSHLKEAKCVVPYNSCDQFGLLSNLLEKQVEQRLENTSLQEIRDSLLPKLLSGELEIPSKNSEVA